MWGITIMTINANLILHQLCDTQFPTGAFSQSFGFEYETFISKVTDTDSFAEWLTIYLHQQLVYCEGLANREVFVSSDSDLMAAVSEWSNKLYSQLVPEEVRYGNVQMGKQFLKLVCQLIPDSSLIAFQKKTKAKESVPHPAIVFCLACRALKIDVENMLTNYYYMSLYNLVQNAVRGIPIGQTSGQKLMVRLQSEIERAVEKTLVLDIDDFGRTSPGLEIAQMKHHFMYSRSFMS